MDLIALAIPAFFVLIGLELLAGLISGKKLYRLNDAISNISCGIGNQVLGVFFGMLTFGGYAFAYGHARFFSIEPTPLNWFLLFLGVDLAYYWFHRLSHEINFIWATHIVHHQSEDYNLSVALRQSWFQTLFSWWFYIPLAVLGFSPLMILSVAAVNTLYQFWIHTQMIKKLPAFIEFIFNTPSHHRVHHGVNPQYIDKNHAGSLIIWDRIFGTFEKENEEVVYGITTPLRSFNPFYANFHYWKELIDISKKAPSFKEKMSVFIKSPGWKPKQLGGVQSPPPVNPKTAQKFDFHISDFQKYYVLIHFVFLLGITTLFLFTSEQLIVSGNPLFVIQAIYISGFILLSLHSFGLLFENNKKGLFWEPLRLTFGIGAALFYFGVNHFELILSSVLSVAIVSGFLFFRHHKDQHLKT
jgi:sterol desaturase/sphingolipid hydroxylase (fatty acid hydroxylase superfamily)